MTTPGEAAARHALKNARRVVIKVGGNVPASLKMLRVVRTCLPSSRLDGTGWNECRVAPRRTPCTRSFGLFM